MSSYKAEAYSKILSDASTAKEVEGHKNSYSPEEYTKIYGRELLLAQMENNGDFLVPQIPEGSAEWGPDGKLIAVGRYAPALFDVARYTANRYTVDTVHPTQADKKGHPAGTYILVAWGESLVDAIEHTKELPNNVRIHRFMKQEQGYTVTQEMVDNGEVAPDVKVGDSAKRVSWKFVGAEMVNKDVAYKMTRSLNSEAMLTLIRQIEQETTMTGTDIKKDSLDDIA